MGIVEEIQKKQAMLDKAIKELATNGYDLAKKESLYKIAINKKALELKAEGVAVTLIQLIIYGYEDISNLRLERDIAETKYNSNKEYLNVLKLQLRILMNQYDKEYGHIN
jgi:hypothetical protein